jgi:hypothetical protein
LILVFEEKRLFEGAFFIFVEMSDKSLRSQAREVKCVKPDAHAVAGRKKSLSESDKLFALLVPAKLHGYARNQLLDLGFFVHYMLACLGIKLHDLHFFWHAALVFVGCVEMTCTSSRFQLDFVTPGFSHDIFLK